MNLAIDSGAHPIVSYALSVDGSFWIDWLLTVLNALYFALPLMTGVVVGLFSGTLSTRFSTRRTVLVGLGIGLFGTGIVAVSTQFYGYYWNHLSGWCYDPSRMDNLRYRTGPGANNAPRNTKHPGQGARPRKTLPPGTAGRAPCFSIGS